MGLSHTVCERNGDVSRKLQMFHTPSLSDFRLKGFPLELGIRAWGQKARIDYRAEKEV